ncbi:MAG: Crp/Fnr family transcriptional regulator [Rubrivivax sp.]|nr:Crp/Fnr family transcriptional regulator [Rubrivivax sp.]
MPLRIPSAQMPPSPNQNHLIAALPADEFEALCSALEPVPLLLGQMLYEPGVPLRHVVFPTTAVVSLHHMMASGASAETCSVGREGMVGVALILGGVTTPSSAVVQTGGLGYRLARSTLLQAFEGPGQLRRLLLRYTQALMTQIAQTAVCYRHHSIEQQLSRWLLSASDRAPPGELAMTQEMVASMLGVRRESVTLAAGQFQDAGYIRYRRGHITVLDPAGLKQCACECYDVVRAELERLLTETLLRQNETESPSAVAD